MKHRVRLFFFAMLAFCMVVTKAYGVSITIPGTYGGYMVITINKLGPVSNQNYGGSATFGYEDFSTIPDWVFNGSLGVEFFVSSSTGELWLDFMAGNTLTMSSTNNPQSYVISFPVILTFKLDLNTMSCLEVVSSNEGEQPILMVNSNPIPVNCDIFQYLAKFK